MITPHLHEHVLEDNLIYCATLQLAWNELMEIAKGPVQLDEGPSPETFEILNRQEFTKEGLDKDCYLAMGGRIDSGIIDRIKGALSELKETSKVDFRGDDPLGFITYAFLKKEVEFIDKFVEKDPSSFNGQGKVKYFGTVKSNEAGHETVSILYYHNPTDFAVQLKCKQENDELILARVELQATLGGTLQRVEDTIKDSTTSEIADADRLLIPVIDFDLEHHFDQLIGARLGGELTGQFIADAVQFIKYNLDAEGARLRSEAAIHTFRCAVMLDQSRSMMFNEPFLLYMKQKGSAPYFAMWVHDDTYLVKGE